MRVPAESSPQGKRVRPQLPPSWWLTTHRQEVQHGGKGWGRVTGAAAYAGRCCWDRRSCGLAAAAGAACRLPCSGTSPGGVRLLLQGGRGLPHVAPAGLLGRQARKRVHAAGRPAGCSVLAL